jgi:hypothetical protein
MRASAPEGRLLKLTHYLLFLEPVRSKLQPNRFSHKRLPLQPHFPVPCWSLTVARHLSFVIPQRSEGICFWLVHSPESARAAGLPRGRKCCQHTTHICAKQSGPLCSLPSSVLSVIRFFPRRRSSCQPPKSVQKPSTTHYLNDIKLPSAWQMSFTQSRILKVVSRNKKKTRPTAGPLHLTGQLTSRPTRAANRAHPFRLRNCRASQPE